MRVGLILTPSHVNFFGINLPSSKSGLDKCIPTLGCEGVGVNGGVVRGTDAGVGGVPSSSTHPVKITRHMRAARGKNQIAVLRLISFSPPPV